MAVSDAEIAHVTDLFADLSNLTTRKMFGGLSIYSDGVIFAIIGPSQTLMLKAKGALAEALAAEGGAQFLYEGKSGKRTSMPYWDLPESALDDPAEAVEWARKSLAQNG